MDGSGASPAAVVVNLHPLYLRRRGIQGGVDEWARRPASLYIGSACPDAPLARGGGQRAHSPWAMNHRITRQRNLRECLRLYRLDVERAVAQSRLRLEDLRGRELGCWCRTPADPANVDVCHGDVLVRMLREHDAAARDSFSTEKRRTPEELKALFLELFGPEE
jgi:hypothetical protein